jgi:hypothetical protein
LPRREKRHWRDEAFLEKRTTEYHFVPFSVQLTQAARRNSGRHSRRFAGFALRRLDLDVEVAAERLGDGFDAEHRNEEGAARDVEWEGYVAAGTGTHFREAKGDYTCGGIAGAFAANEGGGARALNPYRERTRVE